MGQERLRIDDPRVARLGLVGVGAWGRRYIDTVGRRSDARIVAFTRASARTDGDPAGADRHASWRELLDMFARDDLDGLIVATTPDSQAEIAEAAISQGVPLLVEKPIGLSAEAVRRVLRCFRAAAVKPPVVVDYVHLWASAFRAMRARIEAARLAGVAIVGIESEGCNRGPFRGWSPLYDYGCHDLALCRSLTAMDATFRLRDARRIVSSEVPEGEIYEATFDVDAATIKVRVGNGAERKARRLAVTLADGRHLVYDDLRPHPFKLLDDEAPVAIDSGRPLEAVVGHFLEAVDCAKAGRQPTEPAGVSLELSLGIAEIIDGIIEATRHVRPGPRASR